MIIAIEFLGQNLATPVMQSTIVRIDKHEKDRRESIRATQNK
jgi:hypothetical protein